MLGPSAPSSAPPEHQLDAGQFGKLSRMLNLSREGLLFVGVVHLPATPGAPRFGGDLQGILDSALRDAGALLDGGVDAILIENFGDVPFFPERVPQETVATLARALTDVQALSGAIPVGVNVLRNDARAAVGLCAATGAEFFRVNIHTGSTVTDQGLISGRAAETLRERSRLCPDAKLLADVFVKHGVPLGAGSIADAAEDTLRRGLADALILSGSATGTAPASSDLESVRARLPEAPILVGSGLCAENSAELLRFADGAIVGTSIKREGRIDRPVDRERVARLRDLMLRA